MKNFLLFLIVSPLFYSAQNDDLIIFVDNEVKKCLLFFNDSNDDNQLSYGEAKQVTLFSTNYGCNSNNIQAFIDINHSKFPNLESVIISNVFVNGIISLDFFSKLSYISIQDNLGQASYSFTGNSGLNLVSLQNLGGDLTMNDNIFVDNLNGVTSPSLVFVDNFIVPEGFGNSNPHWLDIWENSGLQYVNINKVTAKKINVDKNSQLMQIVISDSTSNVEEINASENSLSSHPSGFGFAYHNGSTLKKLNLSNNQLNSISLTNYPNIEDLDISNNLIPNIDFPYLKKLNYFTSTNSEILQKIYLKNGIQNNFTTNSSLMKFSVENNPSLNEVCVDENEVDVVNHYVNPLGIGSIVVHSNCFLSIAENEINNISIFPNPVKNNLIFSEYLKDIQILDISGKIAKKVNEASNFINLSQLKKGIYFIKAYKNNGTIINKKIIKE